jgi:hypothetical protein
MQVKLCHSPAEIAQLFTLMQVKLRQSPAENAQLFTLMQVKLRYSHAGIMRNCSLLSR